MHCTMYAVASTLANLCNHCLPSQLGTVQMLLKSRRFYPMLWLLLYLPLILLPKQGYNLVHFTGIYIVPSYDAG